MISAGRTTRITMLGGFGLQLADREVRLPAGCQRLVALLALRGRSGRSRLAGTLWPEATERRAMGNLRTCIWRVNQAVPGLVITAAGQVELCSGAGNDVQALVKQSISVLDRASPRAVPLGIGIGIQDGELLPDWDDDWLTNERERLHQLQLHLLERIAEQLAADGKYGLAVEMAMRALRGDELRESAHRTLVRIHLCEGNLDEARRAYRTCAELLRTELGVPPSPAMIRLLQRHDVRSA